jgi:hypothetical protein
MRRENASSTPPEYPASAPRAFLFLTKSRFPGCGLLRNATGRFFRTAPARDSLEVFRSGLSGLLSHTGQRIRNGATRSNGRHPRWSQQSRHEQKTLRGQLLPADAMSSRHNALVVFLDASHRSGIESMSEFLCRQSGQFLQIVSTTARSTGR